MADPDAVVWWMRHWEFLLGGVLLLFAASLITRHWGLRLTVLLRGRRPPRWETAEYSRAESGLDRIAIGAIRFLGNTSLVAGSLIIGILLVAMVVPQVLSRQGPDVQGRRLIYDDDGEGVVHPYSPSWRHPMGTDTSGRDLLSRVVYGTRKTITLCLAVTALRLLIGGGLGTIAGWRRGPLGHQILSFSVVAASIPSLLFAYILIVSIGPQLGFGVFFLGLGLTGWAELTNLVDGTVRWIRVRPFIEAATAIGGSPAHMIRRHLLPNLLPQLLPAAMLELSAVLLVLAELGFLGVLIGHGSVGIIPQEMRFIKDPEWAGLLAGNRNVIFRWPWLPLGPALAVMVAILGFNLLGMGLRGWFDTRQSRL